MIEKSNEIEIEPYFVYLHTATPPQSHAPLESGAMQRDAKMPVFELRLANKVNTAMSILNSNIILVILLSFPFHKFNRGIEGDPYFHPRRGRHFVRLHRRDTS